MKKICAFITAIVILYGMGCSVYADDAKIKQEIQEVQGQIKTAKEGLKGMEEQKKTMSEELLKLNADLGELSDSIAQLQTEIDENSLVLAEAQKEEEESFESFSKRLMTMYEQGSNAYIEIILGSKNLADLINRMDIINEISSHDREIYQAYKDNKDIIEEKQALLISDREILDTQSAALDAALSEKNEAINQLIAQINEKKSEISKLEEKNNSLNLSLSSMDYADTLFKEAEKYLGMPYVFGGSTPETSFDCSGFVCYATTHSGVYNMPRTTAQGIYDQCIKISPSEAKRGDIVFFQGTYNAGETVTHVGFYAGNGKMLHCGNPIQYTSTQSSYWLSHFYSYGRLRK